MSTNGHATPRIEKSVSSLMLSPRETEKRGRERSYGAPIQSMPTAAGTAIHADTVHERFF